MYNSRLNKLRKILNEKNIESLLITNPANRTYLSGFTGTSGSLLITAEEAFLLTDFRYLEQSREEAPLFETIERDKNFFNTAAGLVDRYEVKELAFEADHLIFDQYQALKDTLTGLTLIPSRGIIKEIRSVKDDEELALIRKAVGMADSAFEHILDFIRPGIRERELAAELEYHMRLQGADKASFDIIAASGYRAALPHGKATDKKLQKNEMVVLDFGALYKGYCSDFTRTVVVGKANDKQREIYDIVLKAQLEALEFIGPGKTGHEVDRRARDVISDMGYGEYFGHSLGHGVGMEIHEEPMLRKDHHESLAPGMVVTVEPGIYIQGLGGVRIEDMVIITQEGREILTKSTKKLLEI